MKSFAKNLDKNRFRILKTNIFLYYMHGNTLRRTIRVQRINSLSTYSLTLIIINKSHYSIYTITITIDPITAYIVLTKIYCASSIGFNATVDVIVTRNELHNEHSCIRRANLDRRLFKEKKRVMIDFLDQTPQTIGKLFYSYSN